MVCVLILLVNSGAQIQSTISCPAGHGYWDMLSIMVMDGGLNAGNHMEGTSWNGNTSYKFTTWDKANKKVDYVKNPAGWPWDIFLYDGNFVYHSITEMDWTSPKGYKKNNNGSGSSTSDYSFPWVARCATPGSSSFWVAPPKQDPTYNTQFYKHVNCALDSTPPNPSNVGWALFEVKNTGSDAISDERPNSTTKSVPVTTIPLQYTYNCSIQGDVTSCKNREVFTFAVDATVNPNDQQKHSYGWMRWRLYQNGDFNNVVQWAYQTELKPNSTTPGKTGQLYFPCP